MEKPDQIRITFDQNPAVAEAFKGKVKVGDKGECEVMYRVKAIDEEGVDLIVDAVIPEGYELADEPQMPGSASPTGNDAAPTAVAMMVRRKPSKSAPIPPDV